ncbi:MAG: hypothetical protein ACOC3D_12335, partial [Pseudomonadota bacterium]
MPISTRWLFVVRMDVTPEKEDLFNEVYDDEHIPYLMEVPGVLSVTRAKSEAFAMAIAGGLEQKPQASPAYLAIYEIESPEVLKSEAWATAVEKGRWGPDVRPYTTNRSHV